jgi:hypothetical protein
VLTVKRTGVLLSRLGRLLRWGCVASFAPLIVGAAFFAAPAPASAAEAFTVTQITVDDTYDRDMVLSGERVAWMGTGYFGVSSYGADDLESTSAHRLILGAR